MEKRGYKHGMRFHPANRAWSSMKARVNLNTHKNYLNYGGRGIKYDTKWETFEGFWEDMREGYYKGGTMDRINNNGNYCKENCRWTTQKVQQNNRRSCVILEYKGKKMNVTQWSELLKVKRITIYNRLRYGWTVEETLGTPFKKYNLKR